MKKPISVHVDVAEYEELKELASRQGRPVAELVREAMSAYVAQERRDGPSVLDIPPHGGGRQIRGWTREEIYDEMIGELTEESGEP